MFSLLRAASLIWAASTIGSASLQAGQIVLFNQPPFDGSTALTTLGRQVVGNELFVTTFDVTMDAFLFDPAAFGVTNLSFFGGLASALPSSGFNMIVLLDTDNDGNPATPFNAGSAANLIADRITVDGAGFFVYFNSSLNLNRLVFSTNLNDNTADLKILARIESPTGAGAIAALPTFTESNFETVPEPSTPQLLGGATLFLAAVQRLRRKVS